MKADGLAILFPPLINKKNKIKRIKRKTKLGARWLLDKDQVKNYLSLSQKFHSQKLKKKNHIN